MVARGAGTAGPVLLACRQWEPLGLARRLPSLGVGAWCIAPLLPWRVQCSVRVCAALAARPVRVSSTLARWYAIPRGLCVPRARIGCPSGSSRVPPACVCAGAPAASAPSPSWVVWHAHLTQSRHWALVGPFHAVRAPPRVLPRSLAPSGVLEGGSPVPVPPYLVWLRGASDVRRPPSPDCPPTGRAVGVHYARAVGAGVSVWGPNAVPLACMSCGGCLPRGWRGAVPGGVACRCCEGSLVSGAAPPSSGAGGRGSASRVFRLLSVRAWGPSTGSTACALAGRRCSLWGWRKGVPWAGAFHGCEGRLRSGAPPAPTGRAVRVRHPHAVGAGVWVWGPITAPSACMPCGGCEPRGWRGAVPRGLACHHCEGCLVSGAVPPPAACPLGRAAGGRDPCVPGAVGAGVGTQHRPHSVHPCGPALLAVGVAEGRPWGGCPPSLQGASEVRRSPSPDCPLTGRAVGVRYPRLWERACGCGGPTLSPWPARPVGAACRGGGGRPSPGGVACHRCGGRLVSGAVPPPAARPLGRAAGVPRPVCPRCGRCGRGDPAPAPQRAPLRAGVARSGAGGRASPRGCLPPL